MSSLPLLIVEEHHEAFLAWRYASDVGDIAPTGNALIHVDRHADMRLPRFLRSVNELGPTFADARDFTYSELNIETFIWTSVYLGLFDEWFWVRPPPGSSTSGRMFIHSLDGEGREFKAGNLAQAEVREFKAGSMAQGEVRTNVPSDWREVRAKTITVDNGEADASCPIVLDIDEDYFSCNPKPDLAGRRIEVTREAYEDFVADDLHFLRISPGSRVTAVKDGDRYYLCFNDYPYESKQGGQDSEATIQSKVDALVEFLDKQAITPRFVTVCRSRLSGYTPQGQWSFIEDRLLQGLSALYDFQPEHIADILRRSNLKSAPTT